MYIYILFIIIILIYLSVSKYLFKKKMKCGKNVRLCGVLTLPTGLGEGAYKYSKPYVHGLWPEVGKYGNSICKRPNDPKVLHSRITTAHCYQKKNAPNDSTSNFITHEFKKHGECSGVKNENDYFRQICKLSENPLKIMKRVRNNNIKDINIYANELQKAGYSVWDTNDKTSEVQLSACSDSSGNWILENPKNFTKVCGN